MSLNYKTFDQYYADLINELKLKIISEADNYIISQQTEDLVKFYLNNCLSPIEFDTTRQETIEQKKFVKTIAAHEREWAYQDDGDIKWECENVVLKIPIKPNRDTQSILNLRTNSFSLSGKPTYKIEANFIVFELEIKGYRINKTIEMASNEILNFKTYIQNFLTERKEILIAQNTALEIHLTQYINVRKEKLDSDKTRFNELVKLIKIPLSRKDDQIVQKIQIDRKPFVNKIKPKTIDEDYTLDREKVIDIIKLINSQCLQFEKTPRTYQKFDEPNLRDLILANLNSIFEGKATGETFNNHGKTDIYLHIDKGNILVSECKFYGGEVLYHKTLDQLLGYLSWRHNYGIMISFCKQKNFSKIIEEARNIIIRHPSYNSEFSINNSSHFITKHSLPTDDYKQVEIHHLYYNLYTE